MDRANVRWPASLWAAVTPPGPELPELVGLVQSDVIVIGAGFTGLSTGLHLREAGVEVAIVEAMEPGWGASGRNNGQVIPTLSRPDPEDIVARIEGKSSLGRLGLIVHATAGFCDPGWKGTLTLELNNVSSRCCATALHCCSIWRGVIRLRPSRSRPDGCSRCIPPAASR